MTTKPNAEIAAARLSHDSLATILGAAVRSAEAADEMWWRIAWRLIPLPAANAPTSLTELQARAATFSANLAAAVRIGQELESALLAIRATIPADDESPTRVATRQS